MTSVRETIPIILCGKTLETGGSVTSLLKPDVEVIQFINSFEDAKANLPSLLVGKGSTTEPLIGIGSHDFRRPPRAVVFGRAFDSEDVKELYRLFCGVSETAVAWIAGDPSVSPPSKPGPDYAKMAADEVKRVIIQWIKDGGTKRDILHY